MDNLTQLLERGIFGNPALNWGMALIGALGGWLLVNLLRHALQRTFKDHAATPTVIDDLVYGLSHRTWFYLKASALIYGFTLALVFTPGLEALLRLAAILLLLVQLAIWGTHAINVWFALRIQKRIAEEPGIATTLNALRLLAKLLLWSILLIMALDNLPNVEVTTLLASLGIGSLAVALAVQTILSDLFASFSIALDKPFQIGDFIRVGEDSGRVEHIGLKSTRIRSINGEQLIFANSDLLSSRIRNFKRMAHRLTILTLGISPDTPHATLLRIPTLLQEIVEAQPDVTFERAALKALSTYTLDYELVFRMEDTDFKLFVQARQEILLEVLRRFADEGIVMPYPTHVVQVGKNT